MFTYGRNYNVVRDSQEVRRDGEHVMRQVVVRRRGDEDEQGFGALDGADVVPKDFRRRVLCPIICCLCQTAPLKNCRNGLLFIHSLRHFRV